MSKILKAIMTVKLSYLAVKYALLSASYRSELKTIFIEVTLHLLQKSIYKIWDEDKVISKLFLNVTEIYNNVLYVYLLYKLRMRRIESKLLWWVKSFLNNHCTELKLLKYYLEKFLIDTDILQEFFISLILYLFYNVTLLETCIIIDTETIEYVNNTVLIVTELIYEYNIQRLQ